MQPATGWPCLAADYKRIAKIGSGSFSQVWSGMCPSKDSTVAIKIMDLENISSSFEDILQEVQTMKLADAENILQFYCSFVNHDQLWLVTELMDKGSCVHVMQVSKSLGFGEGMSESCLSYILFEVIKGINYLHNQGRIHRDIKSGNILLNSQGCVKLSDFGVSGWTVARGQRINTVKNFVGTPCYMAPEVMEQQASGYDYRADIWSLGITALELAKGYAPYSELPSMKAIIRTIEDEPPTLRSYPHDKQLFPDGPPFSNAFEDFCQKCLQKLPRNRLKADELLKHKLFRDCDKSSIMNQLLQHVEYVGSSNSSGGNNNIQRDRSNQTGDMRAEPSVINVSVSSALSSDSSLTVNSTVANTNNSQVSTTQPNESSTQILQDNILTNSVAVNNAAQQFTNNSSTASNVCSSDSCSAPLILPLPSATSDLLSTQQQHQSIIQSISLSPTNNATVTITIATGENSLGDRAAAAVVNNNNRSTVSPSPISLLASTLTATSSSSSGADFSTTTSTTTIAAIVTEDSSLVSSLSTYPPTPSPAAAAGTNKLFPSIDNNNSCSVVYKNLSNNNSSNNISISSTSRVATSPVAIPQQSCNTALTTANTIGYSTIGGSSNSSSNSSDDGLDLIDEEIGDRSSSASLFMPGTSWVFEEEEEGNEVTGGAGDSDRRGSNSSNSTRSSSYSGIGGRNNNDNSNNVSIDSNVIASFNCDHHANDTNSKNNAGISLDFPVEMQNNVEDDDNHHDDDSTARDMLLPLSLQQQQENVLDDDDDIFAGFEPI